MMNKKGFTIVELVIVIAVIAILAGVLIPTFGGIVNKANDSKALQEAKNVHTEWISKFDYSTGNNPADDVVVVIKSHATDGQYVVVKDNKFQATVYKTLSAAKGNDAAGANATVICADDAHDWKDPVSDVSTCDACGDTHNCDTVADADACDICGYSKP